MMIDYYVRAAFLTSALEAGSHRLGRPVDRLVMMGDERCRVHAGWRRVTLYARPNGCGLAGDGTPFLGGGGWRVDGADVDARALSDACRQRIAMLSGVISFASGDLQESVDEVRLVRGSTRCLVCAGERRRAFLATWLPDERWWRIGVAPPEPPRRFGRLRVRFLWENIA